MHNGERRVIIDRRGGWWLMESEFDDGELFSSYAKDLTRGWTYTSSSSTNTTSSTTGRTTTKKKRRRRKSTTKKNGGRKRRGGNKNKG